MPLNLTPERITMMPDNIDYPLYTQRAKHVDDTVLGTLGLVLLLAIGAGVVHMAGAAAAVEHSRMRGREAAALNCARTTPDFSDAGIARCYTSRGLPVPGDLP